MFRYVVDQDIYLAILEPRHAEQLLELIVKNTDYIGRWLPFGKTIKEVEHAVAYIESALSNFASGKGISTGIWHKDILVGSIALSINRTHENASIGYWLDQSHEYSGIMTRACRGLITYAFSELRLHRVEIKTDIANQRSRGIPERLSFTQEGIIRGAFKIDDTFSDAVIYGMLEGEWSH
ncbi:GNAT family N-acetyltransferase [Alicyclobacillus sp. ALC3]|uniref:GNAT family N-acetyltransferase n=1 Tax=Alicyclobacillus sp. ALC3 TaxID=2796143 RepID=UPI00237A047F|nr:GNAT family protein [Alicyclobacillus sp. ALC3]WDL97181.1 GNAT family N-acetyltransferase [Alicyclobacillus sp. ALC3]